MDDGGHVTVWPHGEWRRFELQGVANLYEMENTPRMLAVEPDEGTSVGGVPTTITFDIGSGRTNHSNTTVTVTRITLAGVECINPSNLRTIPKYVGKATVAGTTSESRRGAPSSRCSVSRVLTTVDAWIPSKLVWGLCTCSPTMGRPPRRPTQRQYVDYWSGPTTWDDGILPQLGDFVFIYAGRNVVLDVSPPKQTLIWVGRLSFARKNIELRAHYIVVQNGTFEIGTEDRPFEQFARIVLRRPSLPICPSTARKCSHAASVRWTYTACRGRAHGRASRRRSLGRKPIAIQKGRVRGRGGARYTCQ